MGARILWFGDLSPTGFGTVTADLGKALLDLGEDVRFVSQNELGVLPEPFASRTIDQRSFDVSQMVIGPGGHIEPAGALKAADIVPKLLKGEARDYFCASGHAWGDWKPDIAIILSDFVGARLFMRPFMREFANLPTFHYVPIEGIDLPPLWSHLWRVARPVACSEFGADMIEKVMAIRPPVVYHGIDTDVFRPATKERPIVVTDSEKVVHRIDSKERAKAFFGFDPRRKWILRTDRHMPRKNYNSMFRALAPVMAQRPDVDLVVHCQIWDQGGFLPDTLSKYTQDIQNRTHIHTDALPREILAIMYNAADVYVSTCAEGFGLTIAEAIACGTPAVGLEYSAVPEVIGPAGMVVPVGVLTDNEYDHLWARPDEGAMGTAVAWILDHKHRAREIGARGPDHVKAHFQWTTAARQFHDLFARAVPDKYRPAPAEAGAGR